MRASPPDTTTTRTKNERHLSASFLLAGTKDNESMRNFVFLLVVANQVIITEGMTFIGEQSKATNIRLIPAVA